jgi:hypothetical protein
LWRGGESRRCRVVVWPWWRLVRRLCTGDRSVLCPSDTKIVSTSSSLIPILLVELKIVKICLFGRIDIPIPFGRRFIQLKILFGRISMKILIVYTQQ